MDQSDESPGGANTTITLDNSGTDDDSSITASSQLSSQAEGSAMYRRNCEDSSQMAGRNHVLASVTNIARKDLFRIIKFYKAPKNNKKKDTKMEKFLQTFLENEMNMTFGAELWSAVRQRITKSLRTRRCTTVDALKKLVVGKHSWFGCHQCKSSSLTHLIFLSALLTHMATTDKILKVTAEAGNNHDVLDLLYTSEHVGKIGIKKQDGTWELETAETIRVLAWLCNWFLSGVISAETWKEEATLKVWDSSQRRNIFDWATPGDIAFLAAVYQNTYCKWKKQAEYQKCHKDNLSKEEMSELKQLSWFGKDGVSSAEGQKRLRVLQIHIGVYIGGDSQRKEDFSREFWGYYDANIKPGVLAAKSPPDNSNKEDAPVLDPEEANMEEEYNRMQFAYATNLTAV